MLRDCEGNCYIWGKELYMTISDFEKLLLQSESSILDFKRELYDLSNDIDGAKTAKFIKDIISFSNTIRTETAYIIVGVDVKENGLKEFIGLNKNIDDSIFQEKIKNKVFPIPKFSYSTIHYNNMIFGIFEIPVTKYEFPISSTLKLKGIEPGKFYFRRGSSNSEANGLETINIFRWIESLPTYNKNHTIFEELRQLMYNLTQKQQLLSASLAEVLLFAKKYMLNNLLLLCTNELSGYDQKSINEEIDSTYSFRTSNIICTYLKLQLSPYFNWDPTRIINEMREMDGVYSRKLFFPQSILEIENIIERLSEKPTLYTTKSTGDKISGDSKYKDLEITIYANKDNFDSIYKNVRQKLIDELLNIN